MSQTPSVIPCLRHRDAAAAITFLKHASGLAGHAVHPGEGGRIEHARLTSGNSAGGPNPPAMRIIIPVSGKPDGPGWRSVAEAGGFTPDRT